MLPYPNWVLGIAIAMIVAGILPIPIVFCLRRFQILSVDLDIHQGSIRRNETTASTKVMMDDEDVSSIAILKFRLQFPKTCNGDGVYNVVIISRFLVFDVEQYAMSNFFYR